MFLADGPSDLALASQLAAMCADLGWEAEVTPVDPRLISAPTRSIEDRLRYVQSLDVSVDVVFIHRDAENMSPDARHREVIEGFSSFGLAAGIVPVVPVRMTEAWLLLDGAEIRRIAGRPNGRAQRARATGASGSERCRVNP